MAILNQDTTVGGVNVYNAIMGGGKVYGPVTTTGTGAAYVATIEDGPESLYTGLLLVIILHTEGTSTIPKLNVNSLGAKSIYLYSDTGYTNAVAPGSASYYAQNKPLLLMYDGSYFRLLNYNEASWSNINSKPSSFTPSSHATSSTTYGAGTSTNYGHVRLGNNLTQSSSGQYALDAYQGKVLNDKIGNLSSLSTSADSNLVAAINECFQDASNGKTSVVNALLAKGATGITTSSTWAQIVNSINGLSTGETKFNMNIIYKPPTTNGYDRFYWRQKSGQYERINIGTDNPGGCGASMGTWQLIKRHGQNPWFRASGSGSSNYNGRTNVFSVDMNGNLVSNSAKMRSGGVAGDFNLPYIHHNGKCWVPITGDSPYYGKACFEEVCYPDDSSYQDEYPASPARVEIPKPTGITTSASYIEVMSVACTYTGTQSYVYSVVQWASGKYYIHKNQTLIGECSNYDYMEGHPSQDKLFAVDGKTLDIYTSGKKSKTITLTNTCASNGIVDNLLEVYGSYLIVSTANGFDKYDLNGNLVKASDISLIETDEYGNFFRKDKLYHLPKNATSLDDAYLIYTDFIKSDTSSSSSYLGLDCPALLNGGKFIDAENVERDSESYYVLYDSYAHPYIIENDWIN